MVVKQLAFNMALKPVRKIDGKRITEDSGGEEGGGYYGGGGEGGGDEGDGGYGGGGGGFPQ